MEHDGPKNTYPSYIEHQAQGKGRGTQNLLTTRYTLEPTKEEEEGEVEGDHQLLYRSQENMDDKGKTELLMKTTTESKTNGENEDDGLLPKDGSQEEERFRVDRQKLEAMILGRIPHPMEGDLDLPMTPSGHVLSAEAFFTKVMKETHTVIRYPKFLKAGARSKKDPHVRIFGSPEGVQNASFLIKQELEPPNKVTMKMEVPWTFHSTIIGKAGATIQPVAKRTGVSIHFPDCNKTNSLVKSNQVSINCKGEDLQGLEDARQAIRSFTPLVLSFTIVPSVRFSNWSDINSLIQFVQKTYGVEVQLELLDCMTVVGEVKGSEQKSQTVITAAKLIIQKYCSALANQVPVQVRLVVTPQFHAFVLGRNKDQVQQIMHSTNTTISFPDWSNPNLSYTESSTIVISGAVENVHYAYQNIIGALPLVLLFDLPPGTPVDKGEVSRMMREMEVQIILKTVRSDGRRPILVKGPERNATQVYHAWRVICGVTQPPPNVSVPLSYHILEAPTSPRQRQHHHNNGHTTRHHSNGVGSMHHSWPVNHGDGGGGGDLWCDCNGHSSSITPTSTPTLTPNHTPGSTPTPTPTHTPAPTHTPMNTQTHTNHFNHLLLPSNNNNNNNHISNSSPSSNSLWGGITDFGSASLFPRMFTCGGDGSRTSPPELPRQNNNHSHNNNNNNNNNNNCEAAYNTIPSSSTSSSSSPSPNTSLPPHPSTITNTTTTTTTITTTVFTSPTTSPSSFSSSFSSSAAATVLSACDSTRTNSTEMDALSAMMNIDWRAPGCEKSYIEKFVGHTLTLPDYNSKKVEAQIAMKQDVVGSNPRTPTSNWSGYGFSKSMPAFMIQQRLHQARQNGLKGAGLDDWRGDLSNGEENSLIGACENGGNDVADVIGGVGDVTFSPLPSTTTTPTTARFTASYNTNNSTTISSITNTSNTNTSVGCRPRSFRSPNNNLSTVNFIDCELPSRESERQAPNNSFSASATLHHPFTTSALSADRQHPTTSASIDISSILTQIKLPQYIDIFLAEEVDLKMFMSLKDYELKELGIPIFGHRKRILMTIKELSSIFPYAEGGERNESVSSNGGEKRKRSLRGNEWSERHN